MTSVTATNALMHLHLQLDFVPFLGVFFEMVLHGKSRWQQIVFLKKLNNQGQKQNRFHAEATGLEGIELESLSLQHSVDTLH